MKSKASVPDTQPHSWSSVPDTEPTYTHAQLIDPGMSGSPLARRSEKSSTDHRGRPIHAGTRSNDPFVQSTMSRRPTVPSIISRQGVADTARRAKYSAAGAAMGSVMGTLITADSMRSGTVSEWASPGRLATGAVGGAIGAAIGAVGLHKIMKEED